MNMIDELRSEVKRMMGASGHDYQHVQRVYAIARKIGSEEGADMLVLEAAALLHDLGRAYEDKERNHADVSVELAEKLLERVKFPPDKREKVLHAIGVHSYRRDLKPQTLEAKILQDADRLDAIGAVGIMRCFTFGGAHGRRDYHAEDPFFEKNRELEGDKYSLDHFYEKLLKLKHTLHTKAARRIAEERERYMRGFIEQLKREIRGEA
jgi:uncharacterized protein